MYFAVHKYHPACLLSYKMLLPALLLYPARLTFFQENSILLPYSAARLKLYAYSDLLSKIA